MRRRRSSDAFLFSLSEFAFILLFVLVAFGVVLFTLYAEALAELEAYEQRVEELTAEVTFLSERLEELEGGVVPCWRRPDATIPRTVGLITIHTGRDYSISPAADSPERTVALELEEEEPVAEAMRAELRPLFAAELQYAAEHNCYLRVEVENETDEFPVYRELVEAVRSLGIVVAQ